MVAKLCSRGGQLAFTSTKIGYGHLPITPGTETKGLVVFIYKIKYVLTRSWDSSVDIAMEYRLDGRGSIPGKG
jgi:hypothetical protein